MDHLTPKEAAEFLHDNPKALFIDCRSEMEFLFVGHPAGVSACVVERRPRLGDQSALRRRGEETRRPCPATARWC